MSIEQTIQENTKALTALTATFAAYMLAGAAVKSAPAAATPKADSQPAAETAKPEAKASETPTEQPAAPTGPEFDEVAKFVTDFIKSVNAANKDVPNAGKTKALGILVPFVGEGKTLQAAKGDADKLAKILAAFQAADTTV